MTAPDYRQLIMHGINGLPPEMLAEITDFVYFVRKRVISPKDYRNDMREALLTTELQMMDHAELVHLEQEFEGYAQLYPINLDADLR
jgi:hypothetical protein